MGKHPEKVERYPGSLEELAEDVVNMRYDSLAKFMGFIAERLRRDARKDRERGRRILAGYLRYAAEGADESSRELELAWQLSEPYMKRR